MSNLFVVLELGEPLGFLRFADRALLTKRLAALGASVVSVVDERVGLVLSRDVTAEEFDSSLALHQAIKADIPIVRTAILDELTAAHMGDATMLAEAAQKHLVGIPGSSIAKLLAASTFTTLAKDLQSVEVADYSEATARLAALEAVSLPVGWPSWSVYQLDMYDVVRQVVCDDKHKVELHHAQLEPTLSGAPQAAAPLPFRIMCSGPGQAVGCADVAMFFSSAAHSESAFARLVAEHGGMDATCAPPATYGSLRSCSLTLVDGKPPPSTAPQAILDLVEYFYKESWKCLVGATAMTIATSGDAALQSKTLLDVVKAESILRRLGEVFQHAALHPGSSIAADVAALSTKFFAVIPQGGMQVISSIEDLERACDVTRCLRAMLSVGEAACGNIYNAPTSTKLSALGCVLRTLPADHTDYHRVCELVTGSVGRDGATRPAVRTVVSVHSDEAHHAFRRSSRHVDNHQLLFHGTRASNVISILREGLQVPLCGRLRRDAGMLGRGIYFGDSVYTALKYTDAPSPGKYWVLVSEVALGRPYDVREHRLDLVEPPSGFDSVHGIPSSSASGFTEDEYVVYDASRTAVSFLVEIEWRGSDATLAPTPSQMMSLPFPGQWSATSPSTAVASVDEFRAPAIKDVEGGLRTASGQLVPLRNTRIRGKIVDMIAEVDVLQQYTNDSDSALETKYVFPLQSGCAVCAFEAYINDKRIVGVVKEKEEARREYKAAVERGDGAYLLDESEETPDVFTVSVGNLPPKTDVVVRITYVLELRVHPALQAIEFIIPAAIVPTKEKQTAVTTQTKTRTEWSETTGDRTGLELSIDMPFDIVKIECSQPQSIQRKRSACRAVLKASQLDLTDGDFVLYTYIRSISTPRIWVETHPKLDTSVAMITFFPEIDVVSTARTATRSAKEVLILVDCSASMKSGDAMDSAKQVAILALRALPRQWKFNVVLFGTQAITLFPRSRSASLAHVEEAAKFVQSTAGPWLGGSCLGLMLPSLARFVAAQDATLDVLLISDGQLPEGDAALCCRLRELPALRLFTAAVGKGNNATTLRSLSVAGRGQCEVFSATSKSKWHASTAAHIRRMSQDSLSRIQVDWSTEQSRRLRDATNATIRQSPAHIASVFSQESTVVYGLLHHSNALQCELSAVHCGQRVERDAYGEWPSQSFLVTTTSLSFVTGAIIHRLCAKAQIREYTEGLLTMGGADANEAIKDRTKQSIIDTGCLYGLVTPFTSMIAVEERTAEERAGRRSLVSKPTPSIDAVAPCVDVLPEEMYEDALSSSDDEQQFSIVGKQHKKHLKAQRKRREEARRRRLDDEWVRPVSSAAQGEERDVDASQAVDDSEDERAGGGMGTRQETAGSRTYAYPEPAASRGEPSSRNSDAEGCGWGNEGDEGIDLGEVDSSDSSSDSSGSVERNDCRSRRHDLCEDECDDAPIATLSMAAARRCHSEEECEDDAPLAGLFGEAESVPIQASSWQLASCDEEDVPRSATRSKEKRSMKQDSRDERTGSSRVVNMPPPPPPPRPSVVSAPPPPCAMPAQNQQQQQQQQLQPMLFSAPRPCPAPPAAPTALRFTDTRTSEAAPRNLGGGPEDMLRMRGPSLAAAAPSGGGAFLPGAAPPGAAAFGARPLRGAAPSAPTASGFGSAPMPSAGPLGGFGAPPVAYQSQSYPAAPPPPSASSAAPTPASAPPLPQKGKPMSASSLPQPPMAAARPQVMSRMASAAAAPQVMSRMASAAAAPPPERHCEESPLADVQLALECAVVLNDCVSEPIGRKSNLRCAVPAEAAKKRASASTTRTASKKKEAEEMDPDLKKLLEELDAMPGAANAEAKAAAPTDDAELDRLLASLNDDVSRMRDASATCMQLMNENMDCVLSRSDCLERIVDESEALELQAAQFYKASSKLSTKPTSSRGRGGDDELMEALALFDQDNKGYITPADVKVLMANLGERMQDDEIEAMFQDLGTDEYGRIAMVEFAELVSSGRNSSWSRQAIRLFNLPTHFNISQFELKPKRFRVDCCPATGMCLGTAVVDFGGSEEEAVVGIVYTLLLCQQYGWGWRIADNSLAESSFTFQEVIEGLRSAEHLLRSASVDLTSSEREWLPLLDDACGLPRGALLSIYHRYHAVGYCCTHESHRSFAKAVIQVLQRESLVGEYADLARCILPYSTTYVKAWDVFVWPSCVPRGALPYRPFPFSVVPQTDARNFYEDPVG